MTSRPRAAMRCLAALVVAIGALSACGTTTEASGPAPAPTAAAAPSAPAAAPLPKADPAKLVIPSLGVTSSLIPTGLDSTNHLVVPPLDHPEQASWYSGSPTPGAVGPSVLLGHVNGGGRDGVFAKLSTIAPGATVEVDRTDHTAAVFTVDGVETVAKDSFPSGQVYSDTPDAEVRLITCGGDLDRQAHNYLSNVVVFGHLTASHPL